MRAILSRKRDPAFHAVDRARGWLCTRNQDEKYLDGVSPMADLNMTMKALGDLNPTS